MTLLWDSWVQPLKWYVDWFLLCSYIFFLLLGRWEMILFVLYCVGCFSLLHLIFLITIAALFNLTKFIFLSFSFVTSFIMHSINCCQVHVALKIFTDNFNKRQTICIFLGKPWKN